MDIYIEKGGLEAICITSGNIGRYIYVKYDQYVYSLETYLRRYGNEYNRVTNISIDKTGIYFACHDIVDVYLSYTYLSYTTDNQKEKYLFNVNLGLTYYYKAINFLCNDKGKLSKIPYSYYVNTYNFKMMKYPVYSYYIDFNGKVYFKKRKEDTYRIANLANILIYRKNKK